MRTMTIFVALSFGLGVCNAQWMTQSSGTTGTFFAVSFSDSNNGTAVGGGYRGFPSEPYGLILRTTDGGQNWISQSSGTRFLSGVSFTDSSIGTVVGDSGTILRTTDGGQHWISQSSGTDARLNAVSFTDANSGTAVGADGIILRTRNGGVTFVEGTKIGELPSEIVLSQNYPNPFNPSTTIRYGLPSRSHVTLTAFNTLGQQVATLVQAEQEAGYHEVQFDAPGLASGVYLYRLQTGEFVQVRKLVVLR